MMLLGEEGRWKLDNRPRTSQQLFPDYHNLVSATLSDKYPYESKRPLEKFRAFIGEYSLTIELAVKFLFCAWRKRRAAGEPISMPLPNLGYPTTIEYALGRLFVCCYGQEPDGVTRMPYRQ